MAGISYYVHTTCNIVINFAPRISPVVQFNLQRFVILSDCKTRISLIEFRYNIFTNFLSSVSSQLPWNFLQVGKHKVNNWSIIILSRIIILNSIKFFNIFNKFYPSSFPNCFKNKYYSNLPDPILSVIA